MSSLWHLSLWDTSPASVSTESVRMNSAWQRVIFERKLSEPSSFAWRNSRSNIGVKMGQIAMAWVGQKATSPVEANSIKQLEERSVTGIVLTPKEVAYLEAPCVSYPCVYHIVATKCLPKPGYWGAESYENVPSRRRRQLVYLWQQAPR